MRNILIEELQQLPIDKKMVEVVERKGTGHPDHICDGAMNQVSIELSKEYIKKFGRVLHHNTDKCLLAAGRASLAFGGGRIDEPMLMVMGDRATYESEGIEIPVEEIAVNATKKWFKENLRFVEPDKNVCFQNQLRKGSAELTDIFSRKKGMLDANDTSAAVGYAPMSKLERLVLDTELFLNSKEFKKQHPESGEDIKVMGLRVHDEFHLTVAMAFVGRFIDSEQDYFSKKKEMLEEIRTFVVEKVGKKSKIDFNTLDVHGRGVNGVYLTVLGTSAEDGDSGQVGRGNRVNGIIPLNRPISNEAAAGKNPVSHVGKIYNLLTHKMANHIYKETTGLDEVYVWLLSQIGQPVDQPKVIAVQLVGKEKNSDPKSLSMQIEEIIEEELSDIQSFCKSLTEGKIPVC
ncbi:MAG: methionine adenosyltransferase [Candidatus Micrarchaeota archaeon]|nr:methionine adenosyltransferase [Candidatus Micrarchaeota archaeon]